LTVKPDLTVKPNAVVELKVASGRIVRIGNAERLSIIAGPCAMESRQHALETAHALKEIAERLNFGLVYKTSFDKANRTSIERGRGIGLGKAMAVFAEIRETLGLPVLTDVHEVEQCGPVAEVVDVLQIPAFLSRQTNLILAAARTGRAVNIKKGQFLAPGDMQHVIAKALSAGNPNVMACERGVSFGYNTLVNDMRALPILAEIGCPVVFDATHSVAQPGGGGDKSSGERRFIPVLAKAAVAVGVAAVFMETHEDPDRAPSDGPNMLRLEDFEPLVRELLEFDALAKRPRQQA
jgi:2-dehydro-3-deoxyphosphooctonate aldolase (KDO 8-P synthase)